MPIRINRVYTRTGDRGSTHLVGGNRVAKDSGRIEAFGAVDELNAAIGLARAFNEQYAASPPAGAPAAAVAHARELDVILKALQNELFDLGSELATPADLVDPRMFRVGDAEITALERSIDRCQTDLKPLQSFILPGGGPVAAFLHQARTVCRRAEREVVRLSRTVPIGEDPVRYLNRLSDLLFVLSRWIALHTGQPEPLWERGLRLSKSAPTPSERSAAAANPAPAAKRTDAAKAAPTAKRTAAKGGGAKPARKGARRGR